jgi:signal transduction histidine kinase
MDPGETEIFIAVLLASCILGIIIVCFFIIIAKNHKRFLQLQHQQLIAEISALECERKRIVSDLHDDLGPLLAAVKFQIATLDTTLKSDVELIAKASSNIDNILGRIREICNHMLPDVLTRKGLFTAVNEFIEQIGSRTSMHIVFSCQPAPISQQSQLHIYRMVQEIINNAVKHSGATRLQIDINQENDKLILEVSDNGKGFNTNAVINNNTGLGIKNIFGRTRMLDGDMYLISAPGKGTTYKIEIPIACNELQDTIDDRRRS